MKIRHSFQALAPSIIHDLVPIALRAYVPPNANPKFRKAFRKRLGASNWTLIFDTETSTDSSQLLKIGGYQLREGAALFEAGVFFDPEAIKQSEQDCVQHFAKQRGLQCKTVAEFVDDVFYGKAFELRATFVGFNLPFDLSRLAVRHGLARGKMHGGFTFQLSSDKYKPFVQIKHLSRLAAFIQFAGIKRRNDTKGMRKKQIEPPIRRGAFIDVQTIAAALTSQSFSLYGLANFLKLESRKLETNEHGLVITPDYVNYAVQDAQVTWEAYQALVLKFEGHSLQNARLSQILSEASLGRAYLKEMGIKPWREVQPEFPEEVIGTIMSTYFGGRAEVHIRRKIARVLYCDFLSMYPTVCTLMGLWRFVIANGMSFFDTTAETSDWLDNAKPDDLQSSTNWRRLATLVQIHPDDDVLPVRAQYQNEGATTIGLNHLKYEGALWFTLADCLASKFLNGKAPRVLKALTFEAKERQTDLQCINIGGAEGQKVNPVKDDFYRLLIDRRTNIKDSMKLADPADKDRLESEQLAIKILANSTSYGIFVEINVEDLSEYEARQCHFGGDNEFPIRTKKAENAGPYFNPL